MSDEWTWWQNALVGVVAPIHDGDPQTGYYRIRRKGRDGFLPVAYWKDAKSGEQRCHMDGQDLDLQRGMEIWPFASKQPVTHEAYWKRLNTGKWPDESAAVVGHNAAPLDDSTAAIAERIADLAREAEKLIAAGAAPSQEISDQASDLANTFGELENKVTALHRAEKQPHLDAGRAVDTKWFGLRDKAADLKRRLKAAVVTPFLTKKADEVAKANVAAIASGTAPEALPQQRLTAGSSKRQTALRTQTSAEVTDWPALLAALKDHPDIREAAQRVANASAKAGVELPGMKIIKTKVAA
jgi:hypothetical protein